MFSLGEKVRCIDDRFSDSRENPYRSSELSLPVQGVVYTIRSIVNTLYGTGVRLEEVVNREFYFQDIKRLEEPVFSSIRFESFLNTDS